MGHIIHWQAQNTAIADLLSNFSSDTLVIIMDHIMKYDRGKRKTMNRGKIYQDNVF